jgi:hypothetical protein
MLPTQFSTEAHFLYFGKLDPEIYQKKGLGGFKIFPYQDTLAIPKDSILLFKEGQEVLMPNRQTFVIPLPDAPPAGSALLSLFPVPGSKDARAAFKIYRSP